MKDENISTVEIEHIKHLLRYCKDKSTLGVFNSRHDYFYYLPTNVILYYMPSLKSNELFPKNMMVSDNYIFDNLRPLLLKHEIEKFAYRILRNTIDEWRWLETRNIYNSFKQTDYREGKDYSFPKIYTKVANCSSIIFPSELMVDIR